ncbi:hypothetical protein N44_01881 [Microcystis aeruginosa NIES-44]|uniref:Uncharacterized protein n=1 Tax=Microcystis aeruginosa NIES-44 TaxID=449439 RepID=A0A0A1VUA9_MICAE|nr:hypothetical protein N44_01881 [Microcystis aeruginosa NIES-44]
MSNAELTAEAHTPHPTPYTPPAPPMSGGLGGPHPTPLLNRI